VNCIPWRTWISLTLFAAVAACALPSDPGGLQVELGHTDDRIISYSAWPAGDKVRVMGYYGSNNCYTDRLAQAQLRGDTINFTLELRGKKRGTCTSDLVNKAYIAFITGIPAGSYTLKVQHFGTSDWLYDPVANDLVPPAAPPGVRLIQAIVVE
jgi:hypothetical protein